MSGCPGCHPGVGRVGKPGDWHPPSFLLPPPSFLTCLSLSCLTFLLQPSFPAGSSLGSPGFPEASGPRARDSPPPPKLPCLHQEGHARPYRQPLLQ